MSRAIKLTTIAILSLIAAPAFAAVNLTMGGIVEIMLYLLGAAVIFGILWTLINWAPFIVEPWKQYLKYVLYALAGIAVIFWILGMMGQSPVHFR